MVRITRSFSPFSQFEGCVSDMTTLLNPHCPYLSCSNLTLRWQAGSTWIPEVDFPSSLPLLGSPNSGSTRGLDSIQRPISGSRFVWSGERQYGRLLSILSLSDICWVYASPDSEVAWTTFSRCELSYLYFESLPFFSYLFWSLHINFGLLVGYFMIALLFACV